MSLTSEERYLMDRRARKFTMKKMDPTSGEIKPTDWDAVTAKEWDHKQGKFLGEPTKNFWLKKHIYGPLHDPTNIPMSCEHNQYVIELLKKDKIRYPHVDLKYAGFQPEYSHKLVLEKDKPDMFDFWFTWNKIYGKHYLTYK